VKRLLAVAAIAEAATGIALVVVPLLVGRLLLGAEFSGAAVIAGRVAGLALIALGVACWPHGTAGRAICGMLTYSLLVSLYLLYVAIGGEWTGPLLWPVVVLHALLTVLLAHSWIKAAKDASS
jgi:Na+/proline symporter